MDTRRDKRRPDLNASASDQTPALTVVVPVYNEGENVIPTLRGIVEHTKTHPLEVLDVHDMDEDTAVPVVKGLHAEVPELRPHQNTRANRWAYANEVGRP